MIPQEYVGLHSSILVLGPDSIIICDYLGLVNVNANHETHPVLLAANTHLIITWSSITVMSILIEILLRGSGNKRDVTH